MSCDHSVTACCQFCQRGMFMTKARGEKRFLVAAYENGRAKKRSIISRDANSNKICARDSKQGMLQYHKPF